MCTIMRRIEEKVWVCGAEEEVIYVLKEYERTERGEGRKDARKSELGENGRPGPPEGEATGPKNATPGRQSKGTMDKVR